MKTLIIHLNLTDEEAVLEVNRLQQENDQLRELVRLAVKSIYAFNDCEDCIHNDKGSDCPHCTDVMNWQWKHAYKLKELGVEV